VWKYQKIEEHKGKVFFFGPFFRGVGGKQQSSEQAAAAAAAAAATVCFCAHSFVSLFLLFLCLQ
jgi:uncharacterized protein YciI